MTLPSLSVIKSVRLNAVPAVSFAAALRSIVSLIVSLPPLCSNALVAPLAKLMLKLLNSVVLKPLKPVLVESDIVTLPVALMLVASPSSIPIVFEPEIFVVPLSSTLPPVCVKAAKLPLP